MAAVFDVISGPPATTAGGPFWCHPDIGRSTSARALCPFKKVALSSNCVRLRHAEEQSMRTSRPPGMGRRCAPRRQYRPPSGDQHPGDGAMASRPSRRSTTCPWRLSGSSGPRQRIWALGGLVRPVEKIQISGKRAHARAHRDTWRCEDPGKRRKAVKAGRKNTRDG